MFFLNIRFTNLILKHEIDFLRTRGILIFSCIAIVPKTRVQCCVGLNTSTVEDNYSLK